MKIIFWQDIPSPHQSAAIKALASIDTNEVFCVFGAKPNAQRQSLGWSMPDFGKARCIYKSIDNAGIIKELHSDNRAIHIVGGLFTITYIKETLYALIANRQKIFVMTECGYGLGFRKYGAFVKWRYYLALYGKHITGYLGIGQKGVDFLLKCGIKNSKIFPYIYTVESNCQVTPAEKKSTGSLRMLYVGQLIPRKGVVTLLKTVKILQNENIALSIAGGGKLDTVFSDYVKSNNLSEKVSFLGIVKNDTINSVLQNHDVLIVPSLFDGWAAVTNEAIQAGVPVIVSDGAGSVDLVNDAVNGCSYHAGSVQQLVSIIMTILKKPELLTMWKENCIRKAQLISGESVGHYLHKVLANHSSVHPDVPWVINEPGNVVL